METKSKEAINVVKNIAMGVFGVATLATGYLAYHLYQDNNLLSGQVTEMDTKLNYNALEAQYANEAFTEIEANLTAIREREGYVVSNLNSEEFEGASRIEDRIRTEIETIEILIGENNKLIEGLKGQIGKKDSRLKNYQRSVASLEKRMGEYKVRTDELVAQAEELKKDLAIVRDENKAITQELVQKEFVVAVQSFQLDEQEKEMRTGYYAIGSFKELRDSEVIEKEGGLLGIAATKTLKDDFNRERFEQVDIYDHTTIPVFSKGVELVSNHSSESYELVEGAEGEVKWIQIIDPDQFWENTKYLVVVTKGGQFKETAFAK